MSTYHYSLRIDRQNGNVLYADGFIETNLDLSNPEDQRKMREALAKEHHIPAVEVNITSLTRVAP